MATKKKKQQRQQRRHSQRRELQRVPRDFRILAAFDPGEAWIEAAEAAEGEKPKVRRFRMNAYNGGRMDLNGFPYPVVVDLSGMTIPAKARPILRNHDQNRIVGHTEVIAINKSTLRVEGAVSGAGQDAGEVTAAADNGFPWQASLGARGDRMVFVDDGETVKVNGKSFTGPIFVARKSTLREVSFVALGADDNTSAKIAASAANTLEVLGMNFEKWLEAKGFDNDDLSDGQRKALKAMYDAEIEAGEIEAGDGAGSNVGDGDGDGNELNAGGENNNQPTNQGGNGGTTDLAATIRASTAAEIKRINGITAVCKKYGSPTFKANGQDVDILAHAIEENWSIERAELEALRAHRPGAPGVRSRNHDRDCTLQAMQGALLVRNGLALDAEAWQSQAAYSLDLPEWMRAGINDDNRNRIMEAAHRYNDMSMIDIAGEALRIDGVTVPRNRRDLIQAAFSSGTLTKIFTTNVNASLLMTYQQTPDTTMGWTNETDVADFKINERNRMTKGASLGRLPRGGTAEHATRSDTGEQYKIARYARQFVTDEQDMIDDRSDALRDTPREFGEAARRLRPDLVYAILLANAALADTVALFHTATHGNLATGAALADATLRAAITRIEKRTENGVNLNLRASHLIVPSDLRFTASQLLRSAELRDTTANTRMGTRNPLQDENLTLVSDSRLSNGVVDPSTDTTYAGVVDDWYVAAANGHTIEVAYLRGTGRTPTVRSFALDRGQWGMGWDVKMDIGAKALDYRSLDKSEA